MILPISLILDVVLLAVKTVRIRKAHASAGAGRPAIGAGAMVSLRFLALSVMVNSYAHYMILGLAQAFGSNLLCRLVCTAAAKVFVVWIYLASGEAKCGSAPVYLLAALVSLCLHSNPFLGVLSETLLLLFLIYTEQNGKEPDKEEPVPASGRESDLYLKTIEDSYRKNRALMHDLKNHIIVLRSLAKMQEYDKLLEYTDSMAEKISENLIPVHSGNTVLDALLADKYHTARRHKIFVEFLLVRCDAGADSGDLCTVVGNLFDNAIAENLKTNHTGERRISISIRTTEDELVIMLQNPLFHPLNVQNGLPASDKPDLEHHGIGLKNVRRVCDAYGGTLVWDDGGGVFTITARLKMTPNP